ncbi:MAG: GGDEF domain-containing protein, partial [Oscillospiraceae bacterium]
EKLRDKLGTWHDEDFYGEFDSTYNFMLDALISEKEYVSYLHVLAWYAHQIGEFEDFYLCMCENWDNLGETEQNPDYLINGYSKKMCLALHKHDQTAYVNADRKFDISEMLPAIYERRPKPTAFYFGPVHFNDRCFGYSVISYGNKTVSYSSTYRKWMRYVCSSLESLRRQRNLQFMYKKMEENAVTDLLTGIYNRNGFNLYADRVFNEAKADGQNFMLILGDMNNLKYINDSFGHVDGDFAIKSVADAFKNASGPDMMCFRIGGDEFVIISRTVISKYEINDITDSICKYLKNINDTADKPYSISVSLGIYFGDTENIGSVEQALSYADEKMFEAKEKYKREEGFDYRKTHYAK